MNRRKFNSIASLGAIALTTSGFIRFNGTSYVGDCATTTDILGPFYRPDSPVRNDLVLEGAPGAITVLRGKVKHQDCVTPYKDAKVELWHCSADEIYDNDSDEFRYRGTTFCDEQGNYQFTTQMPVPYDAGGGNYRPAHFHLLISAPGYQSLVTQIYFTGDPYLEKDASSASPSAKGRILPVESVSDGTKTVTFDITLTDRLLIEPTAVDKLVGTYRWKERQGEITFFNHRGQLWIKNEVFGLGLNYIGNNTFQYLDRGPNDGDKLIFEVQKDSAVQLKTIMYRRRKEYVQTAVKVE